MQIKLFTIPVSDSGSAADELNRFLRGNKILEVQSQLVSNENGACWCFCVRYLQRSVPATEGRKKTDYKQALDASTFQKFTKLREIRKRIAQEEAIPAFAVFTDEELAGLAKLEKITVQTMRSVKGIGEKKVERYGKFFINAPEKNETPDESA